MFYWSYIYYLSKYWEFIDTFLLVLKVRMNTLRHLLNTLSIQHMSQLDLLCQNIATTPFHRDLLRSVGLAQHRFHTLWRMGCTIQL